MAEPGITRLRNEPYYQGVKAIFDQLGVPVSVWEAILMAESGGSPAAHNLKGEDSVGLFQLNRAGGQGAGYSRDQLLDPVFNAQIAAGPIAQAYQRFGSNIREVARNSGHPGYVEMDDPRLKNIEDYYRQSMGTDSPQEGNLMADPRPPSPPSLGLSEEDARKVLRWVWLREYKKAAEKSGISTPSLPDQAVLFIIDQQLAGLKREELNATLTSLIAKQNADAAQAVAAVKGGASALDELGKFLGDAGQNDLVRAAAATLGIPILGPFAPGAAVIGAGIDALGNVLRTPGQAAQPGGGPATGAGPSTVNPYGLEPPPALVANVQATITPEEFRNYSQDPTYWWRKGAEYTTQAANEKDPDKRTGLLRMAQMYQDMGANVYKNRTFWADETTRARAATREDETAAERAVDRINLQNYRTATLAISRGQLAMQQGNLDLGWANYELAKAKNPAEIDDIYARIAYQKRMAGVAETTAATSQEESQWRYQPGTGLEWQKLDEERGKEKQRIEEAMATMGIQSANILGNQYNTATQNAISAAPNALLPGQQYPMGWEPGGSFATIAKGLNMPYNPPPPNGGTMIYPYQGYQQSSELIRSALESLKNLPPAIVQALAQMAGQQNQPQAQAPVPAGPVGG